MLTSSTNTLAIIQSEAYTITCENTGNEQLQASAFMTFNHNQQCSCVALRRVRVRANIYVSEYVQHNVVV